MQQIEVATLNGYSMARPLLGLDHLLSFGSKSGGLRGLGLEGERETYVKLACTSG